MFKSLVVFEGKDPVVITAPEGAEIVAVNGADSANPFRAMDWDIDSIMRVIEAPVR